MSTHLMNTFRHLSSVLIISIILFMGIGACTPASSGTQTPAADNQSPVIRYLTAQDMSAQKEIAPSSQLEVQCVATDNNDENLSYQWSATGGQIEGEGDRIIWTSPDTTGEQTITVIVTNSIGNRATRSMTIIVTENPTQYPIITSVTCTGCTNGIEASRWETYELTCTTYNPEGKSLQYTWFATTGKIEGQDSKAIWTTLGQYGNALITVIVTDEEGNEAEGYLAVNISCCH
jgi:hypothetical protein